ncbi:hypothetical protein RRG08_027855 [Elysia crispata]|uniref:Uncharacterized protein n=1 Tax=Elysia crispata TaxID=231223 RepID=A0AAE0YTQ9_9GAST|nr:hypothetical protein RRG08_027855 [Elysia crispata]
MAPCERLKRPRQSVKDKMALPESILIAVSGVCLAEAINSAHIPFTVPSFSQSPLDDRLHAPDSCCSRLPGTEGGEPTWHEQAEQHWSHRHAVHSDRLLAFITLSVAAIILTLQDVAGSPYKSHSSPGPDSIRDNAIYESQGPAGQP